MSQTSFEIGDAVWLFHPQRKVGICPKLQKVWKGPFIIIKKRNDIIYRIQLNARTKPKVVHHNRLKLYLGDKKPRWFQVQENKHEENGLSPITDITETKIVLT